MKTTTFIAAAILAATVVSGARSQETAGTDERIPVFGKASSYQMRISRNWRGYLASLNHPLDAVVECAIREVTRLKLAQRCCVSTRIQKRLETLVAEGRTPAVRYKAMLAAMVFERPSTFAAEGTVDFIDEPQLYSAITRRLEKEAACTQHPITCTTRLNEE